MSDFDKRSDATDASETQGICLETDNERTLSDMSGILYCGDNLEVLAEYVPPESVDLIYLDPPFNSRRTFNIVYKGSQAQAEAFKDCWAWEEAAGAFARIVEASETPRKLRLTLRSLHDLLIDDDSDLLAYVTMMSPRLVALQRTLKPTGSLYLHCDPTASHYLKIVLDAIFGVGNFGSEVIWKRSTAHSDTKQGRALHGHIHDCLLFYTKSDKWTWNPIYLPYDASYVASKYRFAEPNTGRLYRKGDLTAAKPGGDTSYEWKGVRPYPGRYWAYSKAKMDQFEQEGRLAYTKTGMPEFKRYLDEMPGLPLQDVWTDIDPINSQAAERLGYPTQKPLVLLDRIIAASSNPGDLVLDPFCGCGTTIEASERLGRRWIGIDIARKAVDVIEGRFEKTGLVTPAVLWHPADIEAARALVEYDRANHTNFFEAWALRKIRAVRARKKDRGIDGEAHFRDTDGKTWHAIVSVKGGKTLNPAMVRELRGTVDREGASIGVLVTMSEPSKEMRLEATRLGFLPSSDSEGPIPRLQFVTVDRLFSSLPSIRAPGGNVTQMPRPSVPQGSGEQLSLGIDTRTGSAPPPAMIGKPRKTKPPVPDPAIVPAQAQSAVAAGSGKRSSSRPPRRR